MNTSTHLKDNSDISLFTERLLAHGNYVYKRIINDMDRYDFFDTIISMITHINNTDKIPDLSSNFIMHFKCQNKPYVTKAVDIYNEIYDIHMERFVSGRSGDAYFDKI